MVSNSSSNNNNNNRSLEPINIYDDLDLEKELNK